MTTLADRIALTAKAEPIELPEWVDEAARLTVAYDDATPDAEARSDWRAWVVAFVLIFGPLALLLGVKCL